MINAKTPKATIGGGHKPAAKDETPTRQPMDRLLFWLTFLLLGVGIVSIYDASYALAIEYRNGDSFYYVKRQALWAVVGLGALLLTRRVPYWKWRPWAFTGIALSVLMLIMVYLPVVGIFRQGSRRWIGHGAWQLQPSELAKLALVVYLARVTAGGPKAMRRFRLGLLPPLVVVGILAVLIAKEPDLGTAIVLSGTGLTMLFLAGARFRHLLAVGLSATAVALLYSLASSYRRGRLTGFFDPKEHAYQVWHGLIALGSGGLTGLGLGEGREKFYIPMARNDFIFPVIAEEWGLVGTIVMVLLFTLVAARGFAIAYKTRDPFGALLAAGVTSLISIQAVINMAVATSSIPSTGVPLPFVSYGGTSLVLMMAGVGLLLNISGYPDGPGGAGRSKGDGGEDDWNRRWEREAYLPRAGGARKTGQSRRPVS